ncbi:MAG: ATP-binding protein [Thermodesulfobacteriota bacterium]|nr:ATP-binding protein [Thermodesulfobacteriota bacterium]
MIKRNLYDIAFSPQWGRQMRFITGPRQAGKTTLARQKLHKEKSEQLYYLWDLRNIRERYKQNELFFTADAMDPAKKLWVCFDEIHKMPKWKNILKAAFDETSEYYQFIVTGSAKLNIMKRSGDSLAGRYFTFHLMPLTLNEIHRTRLPLVDVPEFSQEFIELALNTTPAHQESLVQLLEYSGFPEPFLQQSRAFHNKWARDYIETVIHEDIGTLTRIIDREYIFELYSLLPETIGSPLSQSSLASHLQISPATVKNYLRRLEDFYLTFSIRPYSKNIKRSLLKAGKYYLYDWSRIKNKGAMFENYVACELNARLNLWKDATGDDFHLFYIRNKQQQETDFLVVRNGNPWLLVESKLTDASIDRHHFKTMGALNNVSFIQVCLEANVMSMQKRNAYRMSACRLFG